VIREGAATTSNQDFFKTKNITFSTEALTVMTVFLRALRRKQMTFHVRKE